MKFVSLGDRFAELAVVLLTLVALVLGWVLKSGVENRSEPFSSGNISAQVPAGWLNAKPGGNEVLHVTDRTTSGFGTTYLVQQEAVPAESTPAQVVGLLTLERGNNLTAYRVLNQQEVLVQGKTAVEIEYVYVESDANLSHSTFPVVVHGLDYVFVKGNQAVIVTYRADHEAFERDLAHFNRFLLSVNY
jgi:hypothetical protein